MNVGGVCFFAVVLVIVFVAPGAVTESVDRGPHVRKIWKFGFRWSQTNDLYKVVSCRFLACCSALIGYSKDWLAQCQVKGDWVEYWDMMMEG